MDRLLSTDQESNAQLMSMDYVIENGALIFKYQPVAHLGGHSFPFTVATSVGVPDSIIRRGNEVFFYKFNHYQSMRDGRNDGILCATCQICQMIKEGLPLTRDPNVYNEDKAEECRQHAERLLKIGTQNQSELKRYIRQKLLRHWGSPELAIHRHGPSWNSAYAVSTDDRDGLNKKKKKC